MTESSGRVLLVDDDEGVLRAYARLLASRGCEVQTATGGKNALRCLDAGSFGVIVSDIAMPEMDGLEFLRNIRERDLDVPVIMMTGAPGVQSAVRAFEYGAFRYLLKPVDSQALVDVVERALRLHEMARLKQQAFEVVGNTGSRLGDRAALEARFQRGLELLWVAFQPVVSWKDRRVIGYEALMRSAEPTLPHPGAMLEAAERLGRVHDLGRAVRRRIAEQAADAPADALLFVNLHPTDLNDDDLYAPGGQFARLGPRVMLEITERASLDGVAEVEKKVHGLRQLGFRVVVDDLGAGYAGLSSFTQLDPAVVKLDMSLVRGIDAHPRKQAIVRSMARLCEELGILAIVEGVETPAERDTVIGLGCDLLQGYLFARPERGFPAPRW
jgi:EAL domain-containing protein (putative c-di-GMP-specific phosphodiesterase class I)